MGGKLWIERSDLLRCHHHVLIHIAGQCDFVFAKIPCCTPRSMDSLGPAALYRPRTKEENLWPSGMPRKVSPFSPDALVEPGISSCIFPQQ